MHKVTEKNEYSTSGFESWPLNPLNVKFPEIYPLAKKNFEKALQELEEIVDRLDTDELDLDKALSLFEEGIKLSRFCTQKLDAAEKKIEILLKDNEDDYRPEPFAESEKD